MMDTFGLRSFVQLSLGLFTALSFSLGMPSGAVAGDAAYPRGPELETTPGSLCQRGTTFRYPEHVRYCDRDVDSKLKNEIIQDYDRRLGYSIRSMPRGQFKIDHFIPLCAGGSNDRDNLWPQHKTVYNVTDPLEPLVCQKMASGRLKQADAVRMVREAKTDLSKISTIMKHLNSL